MAIYIRRQHRLPTLNVELRPMRSGAHLQLSAWHGEEELATRSIPAESVGIRPVLSVESYRDASFKLPQDILAPLTQAVLQRAGDDEPCWLQVGSSAGHLAVVPWERLLQPQLGRALLRIPNFLADPVFLAGQLRVALVISSPQAKTGFPVHIYARALIDTFTSAVPRGSEIHVFADADAFYELQELTPAAGHRVVVHDPGEGSAAWEIGEAAPGAPDAGLRSPWLRWIRQSTVGISFDLVHFVCPGFFRGDQGALALARTPARNDDRRWAHMINADELILLLDRVGAWSVGFSPPYENVWAIGLRLLADHIAWTRPCTLFVHDASRGGIEELASLAHFLFDEEEMPPPAAASFSLYTHPRRLARYRSDGFDNFRSAAMQAFPTEQEDVVPEQLAMLATKTSRHDRARAEDEASPWRLSNELLVDRQMLQLDRQDTPARRGALDALSRVQRILRGEDP
jgi:hypothetical protein